MTRKTHRLTDSPDIDATITAIEAGNPQPEPAPRPAAAPKAATPMTGR